MSRNRHTQFRHYSRRIITEKAQSSNRLPQSHYDFQLQSLLRQLQPVFQDRHYCKTKLQITKKESKKEIFRQEQTHR